MEIARSKGIAVVGCCKMPGQLIRTLLVRILLVGAESYLIFRAKLVCASQSLYAVRDSTTRALLAKDDLIAWRESTF